MKNKNIIIVLFVLFLLIAGWWTLKGRTTWRRGGVEAPGSTSKSSGVESVDPSAVSSHTIETSELKGPQGRPSHNGGAGTPVVNKSTPVPIAVGTPSDSSPPRTPVPSPTLSPTQEPVTFVVPGQEGMARHLIPRGVTVTDMRFQEEIVAPGTTFAFDVNGSGFDENFYRTISVDADTLDIEIKNLQLVTANQIHGQITVGDAALTAYVKPLIYIRGKAVFRAPEPFAVIRRGEVLDIKMTSIDESGQWGQFRVITNLDTALFNRLKITPTSPKLELGNFKPNFPFYVDGVIQIAETLAAGQYGLITSMGTRELFRKVPLVDVVKPTIGKTGSIEDVRAVTPTARPGDTMIFNVRGSGFTAKDTGPLNARVPEFTLSRSTVSFVSAGKLQITLGIPGDAAVGVYGMEILSSGKKLFSKKAVFVVVPPNWLSGVKLSGGLKPGGSATLLLAGRDLSAAYVQSLRLEVDEPELRITQIRMQDTNTVAADIQAGANIRPGDYLIHVYAGTTEAKLPGGNRIKVQE